MVKHIILWNFKAEMAEHEKLSAAEKIKAGLEGLLGQIEGLTEIKVYSSTMESSNADLMLDSTFVDEASLAGYQTNPKHVEVATFVRSVMESRKCIDFEF
ncbi:MAG: Dabb family protein [Clostridia bacterium]|nr:Dabb family protein [Clostridia bacterium]